jgi:hypothetical protein
MIADTVIETLIVLGWVLAIGLFASLLSLWAFLLLRWLLLRRKAKGHG